MDNLSKRKREADPWIESLAKNLEEVVGLERRRKIVMDGDLRKEHTCEENTAIAGRAFTDITGRG